MITKIEAYKCSNGRIFDNLEDAKRYETRLHTIPSMISLSESDEKLKSEIIAKESKPGFPDF
jgi:hypothetical protein